MRDDTKFAWIATTVFIAVVASMGFLLYTAVTTGIEEQKKEYAECKQRTTDIEWCFESIFGQELK